LTPIITFTTGCGGATIERLEMSSGVHGGDGGNPKEPTTLGPPAARVVVGVLMMVIGVSRQGDNASAVWLQLGSALALFAPLYGAQRMLERGSPSESPGASL
jgi:hypothetical protein